ncbi:PIKK family atypical protein kinase [Tritrichomonas foetus]|uniref:Serine/threonine-protein kinase TOR n=1 Tax=Tritrichomonas foetus TaxID=1144522 RepID=A0A1J4KMR5_9EUKA|nr:PIKK family atypical protein kinase [Tritrichomonas foetus]|eukprot:OHT10677.1 PIKK family atypical protein kinase [Tritrichomonas foetus]
MKGNAQNQLFSSSELIANARETRRLEYARLSTLNFETLSNVTIQSISSISLDSPTSDPLSIIKIASLVYTLIKLRQDHYPRLIAILNNLNTDKDEQVGILVSFVYSKVLKHAQRGFIQQKLDVCLLKLKSASNVLQTAYFLYFLAKHSPNSILLCITQFINATTKVILHSRSDVRTIGYETLKMYLQILERTQTAHSQHPTFPLFIFAQQNLQKSHFEQHGAFLIFAALLECSPNSVASQASDLMSFFISLLPKCPPDLRSLVLHNLVLLAPLELEAFKSQYFDIVVSALWSDTNQPNVENIVASSLLELFKICPELFEANEKNLIVTLKNLLLSCENAPVVSAFSLLDQVSNHFPLIIQSNSTSITATLLKTKICKEYVHVVPNLFRTYPFIWEQFRLELIQIIRRTPHFVESVDVLELLSLCPPISSHDVTSRLISSLSVSNPSVRCYVPRAILAQISYSDDSFVVETIFRLITISLSDPDPIVREMILRSFSPPTYKFLTTDPILTCISSLVKDEKVNVSQAAIELLGKISKINPFDVLPTLRRLLLDALFMLDSPRPLRIKEEMTRSFLSVVHATEEILPVYCPTLCLIALRQLSFTPLSELTYFDQTYINKINLNITKAIGIIADRDVSLIGNHIPQFVNFFIWLLEQHGPKQLKIAVVNTLYGIMSVEESKTFIQGIDIESMFSALIGIASKWNSKKLNIAVLKLIGVIGAIDQYINFQNQTLKSGNDIKPSNPSYSMSIACKTLLSVVSDDFLVVHHADAIRSLVTIFCSDNTATVSFFNDFMNLFLDHIRKQKNAEYITLLSKICSEAPNEWVMHYTTELLELVRELWTTPLLSVTLDLIPILANVVADRFSPFLPECATFLLDTLFANRVSQPDLCHKVFVALVSLKNISGDYLFLIFPELVEVLTLPTTLPQVRLDALIALRVLVQTVDCAVFSAPIIRCVISCIQLDNRSLQSHSLMILYSIMVRLGELFSFYAEQIVGLLQKKNLLTSHFVEIIQSKSTSLDDFPFIETDDPFTVNYGCRKTIVETSSNNSIVKPVEEEEIKSAIIFQEDETPWNWKEWYRSLVRILLWNSPSPSLFACSFLGDILFNLAENLFNASFLSIWVHLTPDSQLVVSASLTRALLSEPIPGAIRTSLVNLFDFMERSEHPIQISRQVLCQACEKCSQYAKAFYFVYRWIEEDPYNIEALETMIRLSTFLGLKKTLIGISARLQKQEPENFASQWSEKLGQWSTALDSYEKAEQSPRSLEKIVRCLKHLQRWDEIIEKMPFFFQLSSSEKRKVASTYATALYNRQQWQTLSTVLEYCASGSVREMIITALYQISQNKQKEALQTVAHGYAILAQNARGVFKHDKAALYPLLVKAQQLHEISEIAQHKENIQTWEKRLHLCRQSFEVYHQILSVHLTVFPVQYMMKDALKMVKFALRSKDFQLFDSSLHFLFPDPANWPVEVSFLHAKGMWARGNQAEALAEAKNILRNYKVMEKTIKAKIYYMCGQWIISMTPPNLYKDVIKNAVKFLEQSIVQGTRYFKAWHRWAWACSIIYQNDKSDLKFAFNAVNGFLECVRLKNEGSFSELLQMISLFFSANLSDKYFNDTAEHIYKLSDSVLLKIIPQLFTQLSGEGRSSVFASSIAQKLLPEHYHVLLYPLLVRNELENVSAILTNFAMENSIAAHQSRIISDGLRLCSSSLLEIYLTAIISTIGHLQHQNLNKAHSCLERALMLPPRSGDSNLTFEVKNELNTILYNLTCSQTTTKSLITCFSKIRSILSSSHTLSMHIIAPTLAQLRNSILAVPGTYSITSPLTTIFQFDPSLDIFNSKQRPRLVKVYGSDGIQHRSLLKGREDLRMDERVMQFFELINQHILNDMPNEIRKHMQITTYSITPLSTQAGLIQFVDGTDTLFSLINDYRNSHNISVFAESEATEEITIRNVDSLTPIQRLEALRTASSSTRDTDLRELMWLNSSSSREWVSRSLMFTESSALMSIIGYIIGLGDRHPSNLMIQRNSGGVVHIDFGDCFEVSKNRLKFPEKVPFRLTRLMCRAFGPTGVDGEFRLTCEETVKLVRSHKESIMAVLDIFLQEPIDSNDDDNEDEEENDENNEYDKNDGENDICGELIANKKHLNNEPHFVEVDESEGDFVEVEEKRKKGQEAIEESLNRIMQKITGNDFDHKKELTISEQVDELINQATDMYNLAHLYHGWTPLW